MNPDCPACTEQRRHTPEEFVQFHPFAGHGNQEGRECCTDHPAEKAQEPAK